MKKLFLIPIAFLMVTTLSAQPLASSSCADVCQKDALITAARSSPIPLVLHTFRFSKVLKYLKCGFSKRTTMVTIIAK